MRDMIQETIWKLRGQCWDPEPQVKVQARTICWPHLLDPAVLIQGQLHGRWRLLRIVHVNLASTRKQRVEKAEKGSKVHGA